VPALILIYLFRVYGSLVLFKFGLISDRVWLNIDYVGACFLFCSFLYLLKDKVNSFVYSLGMAVFVSRLCTELFSEGVEYWYEMISIVTLTIVLYFIKRKWQNKQ